MAIGLRRNGAAKPAATSPVFPVARILDIAERGLVVLAFAFYFAANVRSMNALNILIALGDLIAVVCILLRRPTDNISLSASDWALAIAGTAGVMLARPSGHPAVAIAIPAALWFVGIAVSIAAKVSLNVRFGLAPANRGVQASGAYALVRHPMYAGYILMGLAYFLLNPSPWNAAVYVVSWTCQFVRVQREERWLGQDPAYLAYAQAVRFRFVPFVI